MRRTVDYCKASKHLKYPYRNNGVQRQIGAFNVNYQNAIGQVGDRAQFSRINLHGHSFGTVNHARADRTTLCRLAIR